MTNCGFGNSIDKLTSPCGHCDDCIFTGNQEASCLFDNNDVSDTKDDGPSSTEDDTDVYVYSNEDDTDVYASDTKDEGSSSKTGYGAFKFASDLYIPETDVSDTDIPSDTNSDPESEQDTARSRRRKKRPRDTRIVSTLHTRKRTKHPSERLHFHQIALNLINSI